MITEDPRSRSAQTRNRLLAAAAESFADRGFHGTTTRDIAAAAGMSPAAVYVHYRSKEELLNQLSTDGHRLTIASMIRADDPQAPPTVRLRSVMRAFAEHHARTHIGARVVNYELAALTPEHREAVGGMRREITAIVRAVVDAGVDSGEFHTDDPRTTTRALLSMGIDIARWYREDGNLTPEQIGDFYAELALRVVGASDGATGASATDGAGKA
jgi:AcrR family transcriptional regulator